MTAIKIFLCMFAVWGIYCAIIELCAFLCGKARIICAVRTDGTTFDSDIASAVAVSLKARLGSTEPVLICESESVAESLADCGYEVYVRYK